MLVPLSISACETTHGATGNLHSLIVFQDLHEQIFHHQFAVIFQLSIQLLHANKKLFVEVMINIINQIFQKEEIWNIHHDTICSRNIFVFIFANTLHHYYEVMETGHSSLVIKYCEKNDWSHCFVYIFDEICFLNGHNNYCFQQLIFSLVSMELNADQDDVLYFVLLWAWLCDRVLVVFDEDIEQLVVFLAYHSLWVSICKFKVLFKFKFIHFVTCNCQYLGVFSHNSLLLFCSKLYPWWNTVTFSVDCYK